MTSFVVEDRPGLRRLFFRLLGVEPRDGIVSLYDSEVEEAIHYFIQHGIWNSQTWLINYTNLNRWLTQQALTWSTDSTKGLQYMDLPANFIRLAGDAEVSALHRNQARSQWGTLIDHRSRREATGAYYWIENDSLWLARDADPPEGLVMDYYYQHPLLDDDNDPIDFPQPIRPLIACEAAWLALQESWVPLDDPETEDSIETALGYWRKIALSRYGRQTQEPNRFTTRRRITTTQRLI